MAEQRGDEVMVPKGPASRIVALVLLVVSLVAVPLVLAGNAGAGVKAPRIASVSCTGGTYTVVSGDGWYRIAGKLSVTVTALLTANGAKLTTALYSGDVLCVPGVPTTTAATTTTTTTTTVPVASSTTAPPAAPSGTASIQQFPVQGICFFGDTFGAPRSGGRRHEGVDIIAPSGKYVYAVSDGRLSKQYVDTPGSLSGNGWQLSLPDGTYFFYAHLSSFAAGLKVGSMVKAGQILGQVGMTGNAGVPHLHFEVHPRGGAALNPTPVVRAVNGCNTLTVPLQPSGAVVNAGTTTVPATTTTTTTVKPIVTTTTLKPAVTTTTVKLSGTTTTVKPGATTTTVKPTTTTAAPTTTVPPTTTTVAPANRWQLVAPVMAYNTAIDGGALRAGTPVTVTVGGLTGVSAGTPGVLVRLVARNVTTAGSVTLHACGAAPGAVPSLSYSPGKLAAVVASAPVSGGAFCMTSTSTVDVRMAVIAQKAVSGVTKQAADRAVLSSASLRGGVTVSMSPAALAQPAGTKMVSLAVSLTSPASAGSIGIGACGGTPWVIVFGTASSQGMRIVVPTGPSGVCITSTVGATLSVKVTGYWG